MARTIHATVRQHENLGAGVHRIVCDAEVDLSYVAGNYVILRSTLPHPDKAGEVVKKAFSISSPPDVNRPRRFALTVQDVGPMSAWVAGRRPGDRLEFSGPWGKRFRARDDDPAGPVVLFATGTGWSPIGAMAADRLGRAGGPVHLWWQTDHAYDAALLEALRQAPGFSVHVGPALAADAVVDCLGPDGDGICFLAGDGAVIAPLVARLRARGLPEDAVRVEAFFNKAALVEPAASPEVAP